MEFNEQLAQFAQRIETIKDSISTEEATKTSIIMPFFQLLGYDIFNPLEFSPEFNADVGIKKGEKVDYAILLNKQPLILIECKPCNKKLDKHCSQLFRYFSASISKFAILTNGINYNFYTDLEESNKMDLTPFLKIDITNLSPKDIEELKKFHKINFNADNIFSSASELKYHRVIKDKIKSLYLNPSDDFVRLVLSSVYTGVKTQSIINRFKGIVQKSFSEFISELVNESISTPLNKNTISKNYDLSTNPEEIEAFYIIRNILGKLFERELISYKITESYTSITYDNNSRKWICRISIKPDKKQIIFPKGKNFTKINIDNVQDLYTYSQDLISSAGRFMDKIPTNAAPNQEERSLTKTTPQQEELATIPTILERSITLVRGQKLRQDDLSNDKKLLVKAHMSIPPNTNAEIDIACFGVDSQNTLAEEYLIFYNQPECENGCIKMVAQENDVLFNLELDRLPNKIQKLVFIATIDGDALIKDIAVGSNISFVGNLNATAEYNFDSGQFEKQKTIILAELYKKNENWTISIVSDGFNGGLEELLKHFGGEVV